jgi:hypothetical protein
LDWAIDILLLLFRGLKFDFGGAKVTPAPFSFPVLPLERCPPHLWYVEPKRLCICIGFFFLLGVELLGYYIITFGGCALFLYLETLFVLDIRVSFCNFGNP